MFNNPSSNRGVLDQTLFTPNPNFLATPLDPIIYIIPRLRSWINWNIPVIISLTAGWEHFLKIQRDERAYTGTYSTRTYCTRSFHFSPECTKIVSGWGSAPDPAGGAYSAPPDPLAVMGWDGDLVTTFLGCKLCAPLLVAGAPLLFWGWLRAWWADEEEVGEFPKHSRSNISGMVWVTTKVTKLGLLEHTVNSYSFFRDFRRGMVERSHPPFPGIRCWANGVPLCRAP